MAISTLGITDVLGGGLQRYALYARLGPSPVAGRVASIHFHGDNDTRMALYNGDATEPTTLIADSETPIIQVTGEAWADHTYDTGPLVAEGQYLWLLGHSGVILTRTVDTTMPGERYVNDSNSTPDAPATAVYDQVGADRGASAYVTIDTTGVSREIPKIAASRRN